VRTILLELHYDDFAGGETIADADDLLRQLGFRLWSLTGAPIADLDRHCREQPEVNAGNTIVVARRG
jgi:hypothetical protein